MATAPTIGWMEVHSENYFGTGGAPLYYLDKVRADYPLSLHGVGLSLGSADPLDQGHLARLKALIGRCEPGLVSEHLAWCSVNGRYLNDLLPVPYTDEVLTHVVERVERVQDGSAAASLSRTSRAISNTGVPRSPNGSSWPHSRGMPGVGYSSTSTTST